MRDKDIYGGDSYFAPTEDQLHILGKIFGEKLKSSTTRATILGASNDNWSFLIEGANTLVRPDGSVRRPDMLITPGRDEWNSHTERSFAVTTSRWQSEENQIETDIFRISIFKNTDIVSRVSKAVITEGTLEFLEDRCRDELRESIEGGNDIITAFSAGTNDFKDGFYRELESQFEFGACSFSEVTELIEILESSTPKSIDPISELLRQYIE